MERFILFLLYLWQLPQCLVGLILSWYYKGTKKEYKLTTHFKPDVYRSSLMHGGISLGYYVFVYKTAPEKTTVRHELGHCYQSLYLGWLYLIVIGLPSLVWATLHTYCKKIRDKYDYYSFYTEMWADKLGGVQR